MSAKHTVEFCIGPDCGLTFLGVTNQISKLGDVGPVFVHFRKPQLSWWKMTFEITSDDKDVVAKVKKKINAWLKANVTAVLGEEEGEVEHRPLPIS